MSTGGKDSEKEMGVNQSHRGMKEWMNEWEWAVTNED